MFYCNGNQTLTTFHYNYQAFTLIYYCLTYCTRKIPLEPCISMHIIYFELKSATGTKSYFARSFISVTLYGFRKYHESKNGWTSHISALCDVFIWLKLLIKNIKKNYFDYFQFSFAQNHILIYGIFIAYYWESQDDFTV